MNRRYERYRTHHRSRRLAGHDYAAPGWYFVTICTRDRACFFGDVHGEIMGLSAVGCVAHRCWATIPDHTDRVRLGAFVVMPNHVHGLIGLLPRDDDGDGDNDGGGDDGVATFHETSLLQERSRQTERVGQRKSALPKNETMSDRSPAPGSLAVIVRSYKGAVTRWARNNGHGDFAWQPRFYDHVVRDERACRRIAGYIRNNPAAWRRDRNHPANRGGNGV